MNNEVVSDNPDLDFAGVADAGVRKTPLVRRIPGWKPSSNTIGYRSETAQSRISPQSAIDADQDAAVRTDAPTTVQDALEITDFTEGTPTTRGTGSRNLDRYAGAVFGSLSSIRTGEPIYNAIDEATTEVENSPDAMGLVTKKTLDEADGAAKKTLEAAISVAPDEQSALGAFKQVKDWRKEAEKYSGFEHVALSQIAGLPAMVSESSRKALYEDVYRQFGEAIVAGKWDENKKAQGWQDIGWDFLKSAFLVSDTVSLANVKEKFDPSYFTSIRNTLGETVGRAFDFSVTGTGYKAYKASVEEFWTKPVEERTAMLPGIHQHIDAIAGDNIFSYMALMQPFVDKSAISDVDFNYTMDTVTIGSALLAGPARGFVKFWRNVVNARKPISILIRTGNVEKAGELIRSAMADRSAARSAKVTGMGKPELAASSQPVDLGAAMPEQIMGAAGEAAKQTEDAILKTIDSVHQVFSDVTDPTIVPRRLYFDEAATTAKQRQYLDEATANHNYPAFARIVDHDPTGFTVEIERGSKYEGRYDADTLRAANEVHESSIKDLHARADTLRDQILNGMAKSDATSKKARKPGVKDIGPSKDTRPLEERADEAFGEDDEVKKIQDQIAGLKSQIRKNNRIIKDLDKPPSITRESVKYKYDDQGRLEVEELSPTTLPKVQSPSQVIDQLGPGISDEATLADFTRTQIINKLHENARNMIRGSTKKQREDVDKLLIYGSEQKRAFDFSELVNGVDTTWGHVKLDSTHSISMYYGIRHTFDEIWRIKNYLKTRGLEVGGYKQLTTKVLDESGKARKVFARPHGTNTNIPDNVRRIYDHSVGRMVDVSSIKDLEKRFSEGWEIASLRHGVDVGDETFTYALVKPKSHLKDISGDVMEYLPGYVPRQRPGIFYIASRAVPRKVNGVSQSRIQTEAFFKDLESARAWVAKKADPSEYSVLPDKNYRSTGYDSFDDEWDDLNFGGPYTGKRTDREILVGLDETAARRTSAYKALSQYMGHISNGYATNELTMNLIGRFQNTYGKYLKNPGNWKSELKAEAENNLSLKRSIEAMRDYIGDLMHMPDPFQKHWTDAVRRIAELMEPVPILRGKPREWTMSLAASDPTAAIRAATFHIYLGGFNPAQFLVQAAGTAIALTAYPTKAMKLVPQYMALRAGWFIRNNSKALDIAAKHAGLSGAWLKDITKELDYTGLLGSLKTTADYKAGEEGINVTADAARRVLDASLFTFREGEMMTRSYGYLLARDLFLRNKKKGYKITNKDADQIAKDSLKYTLNLNRPNRATWQKGPWSVPTQFWQIMAKYWENMIGGTMGVGVRKWTPAEKFKILTGHIAMFGLAGYPWLDSMVTSMVNTYKEATDDKTPTTTDKINIFNGVGMSDEMFERAVRGGIAQSMAYWLTGADPEIVNRMSIPAGAQDMWDMYSSGDKGTLDALGGAMAPGMLRIFDAASDVADIVAPEITAAKGFFATGRGVWEVFAPNRTVDVGPDEWRQAFKEVAQIFSSTRAAEKAVWWKSLGKITDKNGVSILPQLEDDEFNNILLWQTAGFAPAKVGWTYDMTKSVKGALSTSDNSVETFDTPIKEISDRIWTIVLRYGAEDGAIDSARKRDQINARMQLLMVHLNDKQRTEVMRSLGEKMSKTIDGNKFYDTLKSVIEKEYTADGKVLPGTLANPMLGK